MIHERFQIEQKLLSTPFSTIFLGTDLQDNSDIIVKAETYNAQNLLYEYSIYEKLMGMSSIPLIYGFFQYESTNVMIMQRLGPSLGSIVNQCQKIQKEVSFSLALQMHHILQDIHQRGIIHRDIKLDNFLFGTNSCSQKLFLIDFGLATYIDNQRVSGIVGNPMFASINAHQRNEQTDFDDFESLGYCIAFMINGSLPWDSVRSSSTIDQFNIIVKQKLSWNFEGVPDEVKNYIVCCRKKEPLDDVLQSMRERAMPYNFGVFYSKEFLPPEPKGKPTSPRFHRK